MATVKPTSLSTVARTRPCMPIPQSTTHIGASNCPAWIFPGVENFTTEGLSEGELHIGDRLQIGGAVLLVRQPRMPCYKLAAKFQRDDMIGRFLRSGRSGFYFSVEQEGVVQAGEGFDFLSREPQGITIAEVNRLYVDEKYNRELLEKAIGTPALPEDWRDYFVQRLPGNAVVEG